MRFNLIDYIARSVLRAADFSGRSNRMEIAINIAAFYAMIFFSGLINTLINSKIITNFILLFAFLSLISCIIRRLHDQNRSAAFLLVGLIPGLGPLILVAMLFFEGTNGDNEYGPKSF